MRKKCNRYSYSLKNSTDVDLIRIVEKEDDYQEEMILAAIYEIEKRGIQGITYHPLKNSLEQVIFVEDDSEEKDCWFTFPANLPHQISCAVYLLYFSVLAGLLQVVFFNAEDFFSKESGIENVFIPVWLCLGLITYLIHLGYGQVRYLLVALLAVGSLTLVIVRPELYLSVFFVIQLFLQLLAVHLLFVKKSRMWYKDT